MERGGSARSFHIDSTPLRQIVPIIAREHPARKRDLMTDEARLQRRRQRFASHDTVNHGEEEYVRGDVIHTNTVEGYYSIFKRGMKGIYQHCGEKHLHRYLAEFDFRYSNRIALGVDDVARADRALQGIVGKRLTYKQLVTERPHGKSRRKAKAPP